MRKRNFSPTPNTSKAIPRPSYLFVKPYRIMGLGRNYVASDFENQTSSISPISIQTPIKLIVYASSKHDYARFFLSVSSDYSIKLRSNVCEKRIERFSFRFPRNRLRANKSTDKNRKDNVTFAIYAYAIQ